MTRLLRAELLKLATTRLLFWLALLVAGLELLVISVTAAESDPAELARPGRQRELLAIAAVSALVGSILGIVASTNEYAHGTATHTFLVAPVRERVVAAKVAAAAVVGGCLALLAAGVAWGLTALWLSGRSVPLELWTRDALNLLLGLVAAAAVAAAIGVGFGALLRRQTPAIVLALVWLLIGEPLLAVAGAQEYGPGHAVAAVVNAGRRSVELLRFWPGLWLSLAYAALLGLLGALAVRRADVG